MTETMLAGRITAESEFNGGSGACGPCALGVAARWSKQQDTPNVHALTPLLAAGGFCSPTGVSDTPKLRNAAKSLGFTIENPSGGIAIWSFANAAIYGVAGYHQGAVVLQLRNGQALRDYLTGSGEDATNLHGHFTCLVGYNSGGYSPTFGLTVPQGFIAADGDQNQQNPIINGARVHRQLNTQLCYYSLQTLLAAQMYDAFSILPQAVDALTAATGKLASIAKIAGGS